mmetsp:Transcript_34981/g.81988  ORF Transcript_34981/g.81988 Transcript_34981/m.81988 type:complete len:216 (-) Transcript_34981:1797-2444(-)
MHLCNEHQKLVMLALLNRQHQRRPPFTILHLWVCPLCKQSLNDCILPLANCHVKRSAPARLYAIHVASRLKHFLHVLDPPCCGKADEREGGGALVEGTLCSVVVIACPQHVEQKPLHAEGSFAVYRYLMSIRAFKILCRDPSTALEEAPNHFVGLLRHNRGVQGGLPPLRLLLKRGGPAGGDVANQGHVACHYGTVEASEAVIVLGVNVCHCFVD